MQCPRCQRENAADAAFCDECGARLQTVCSGCGESNRSGAKFCRKCGHGLSAVVPSTPSRFDTPQAYTPQHLAEKILTSKAALEGERKQVTVLFADLKGAMELLADRDPEEARKILDPVLEQMMGAVHRYEGTVNQVMGDGIMALFGAPLPHEKLYFQIEGRDETRKIREKVTGKLLSLDRALEPVPVNDAAWEGLDPPQRRQQTLDGVKRLLLRESQVQPLLVLFEDLHWIDFDTETQVLLDSLVESLPTARLLLLVNYRPEYHNGWGNKTYYRQLRIDPLPPASADDLLRGLLGRAPLRRQHATARL